MTKAKPRLVWHLGASTDVGQIRDINEDSYLAHPELIAVADGVGGAAAGEVASAIAIEQMRSLVTGKEVRGPSAEAFDDAVVAAREKIRSVVEDNPESEGMGTTLTALWLGEDEVTLAHIGDSRAYQLRGDDFVQVTVDDSYVQHLIDEGAITKEEAIDHPYRSMVTRVLQSKEAPTHFESRPARVGDRFVVCSDGLTDVVREETVEDVLREFADPQAASERLVELALRAGGPDNITVVVADIKEATVDPKAVVFGSGFALMLLAVGGFAWWAVG
ncbi:PP2C family protein-serine/threonine phosphatase [Natronoglycomyces albus]|uniref:Serine/threonine-protein phosphatase n=1 Tax=Natronoglycomyces albus TaxID=2811108 RepID=A0A895XME3_9ACTN|nr:protein phosphatase 2C domain-containing protein [Natronoglycomyces albus]QSB04569.1 serine/threonine-protein phosphatase [Natronoglycomyces albus]